LETPIKVTAYNMSLTLPESGDASRESRSIEHDCIVADPAIGHGEQSCIHKREDNMAATAAVKEIFEALPHIKRTGAKHLWFDFDYEADVLYVSLERPKGQLILIYWMTVYFCDFGIKK